MHAMGSPVYMYIHTYMHARKTKKMNAYVPEHQLKYSWTEILSNLQI